ncbi:50S ribosomal protein L25/general stress protein Ctc [Frankia sp. CcI49]|uniref:50S ribosomal protein L25/general stress protein Ctc n=1 Tax=unclassified Frankia TaxID=2632575 RepID=UPI0006CA0773|nr:MULTISPECIES: 50S ribosomal protein L25/general stress protein Ctc [unclassified Frankia]KPM57514.1 50S ribosomal protein L25 [Frankia sp. R43]ONH57983.1 50S ribosomal protein L25/general stress protein Ctc [Frankia sp. CcI49]
MSEVRIAAEPRTEFGKGGARRTRRAGKVPAVLYGHGQPPRHIALPAHDLLHAFKTDAGTNVLLTLEISGSTELALPKEVQRHPIRGSYEHVDLVLVNRGERVTVEVAVTLVGDAHPDTLVDQQVTALAVKADATALPGPIEVDITGLEPGHGIAASQLELPRGVELEADAELVIVQGLAKKTAAQVEADLGETAETAEGAETAEAAASA